MLAAKRPWNTQGVGAQFIGLSGNRVPISRCLIKDVHAVMKFRFAKRARFNHALRVSRFPGGKHAHANERG